MQEIQHQFFSTQPTLWSSSHIYTWVLEGPWLVGFVSKVVSLPFNTLSRFVIAKKQASSNFMTAVTICSDCGAQEQKICPCFHFFPSICHEVMGLDAMIYFFNVEFQANFFTLIKKLFSSSLSAIRVESTAYPKLLIFLLEILLLACDSCSLAFCMIYSA